MDEVKPKNPSAFPSDYAGGVAIKAGMTLRDYLAAQVLPEAYRQMLEVKPERYISDEITDGFAMAADIAYRLADAALKRREAK